MLSIWSAVFTFPSPCAGITMFCDAATVLSPVIVNSRVMMIRTAKIVSDESKEDEVGINNTVVLYMEDDDETETYKLVTTVRGNSIAGRISIDSPLGRAILGKKKGQRVYVKVNEDYGYYVVIQSVENTDDAEDQIRSY